MAQWSIEERDKERWRILFGSCLETLPVPIKYHGHLSFTSGGFRIPSSGRTDDIETLGKKGILPYLEIILSFDQSTKGFRPNATLASRNWEYPDLEKGEGILSRELLRGERPHAYRISMSGYDTQGEFNTKKLREVTDILQERDYEPSCGELWLSTAQAGPDSGAQSCVTSLVISLPTLMLNHDGFSIDPKIEHWFQELRRKHPSP